MQDCKFLKTTFESVIPTFAYVFSVFKHEYNPSAPAGHLPFFKRRNLMPSRPYSLCCLGRAVCVKIAFPSLVKEGPGVVRYRCRSRERLLEAC